MIRKLAEGDKMLNEGKAVAEVARSLGVAETTWHRWKNTYGGMKATDAKKLKELEMEYRKLKAIVTDQQSTPTGCCRGGFCLATG